MQDVNWWLMVLSFLLGLVLSLALMIRRVKREVPEYGALGRGPGVDVKAPDVDVKGAGLAAGGAAAGGAAAAKFADTSTEKIPAAVDEPYGAGSVRVAGTASAPDGGYTIKGNEDSMLYHTVDSPSYKQTIAEVWFRDEPSAQRAGFTQWSKGRGKTGGAAKFAEVPPGPHGPGSAKPNADGSGPEGWTVKGNEDSMLYHSPESNAYAVTVAEVWFRDVETAERAGFHQWDSGKSQRGQT